MSTGKGSTRAAALTFVILIAGILLFFQHTRSSSLESGEVLDAPAEFSPSVRVIAEHPPVELIERRDDHTRVWQIVREIETTHPDGQKTVNSVRSHVIEKASGLCYRDGSGSLVPAIPEWRETPDGFVIDRCSYGLSVGRTLSSWIIYSIEGRRAFLRPSCLMASDGITEVSLAVVNSEVEGLVPLDSPSTVRFPDALGEGLHLEFVADKDGFHQNLVLSDPIELPEELNADEARIYLYTEIDLREYAADPSYSLRIGKSQVDLSSETLLSEPSEADDIVLMRTVRGTHGTEEEGRVWWFGESSVFDSSGMNQIGAARQLVRAYSGAQTYLVESIPQSFLEDAAFPVVLDYRTKSQPIGQGETETFDPRYTYWITGDLNVSGRLMVLPGTTVKVNYAKSIHVLSEGKIVAQGEPYNYITFTKASDDSCGEELPGAPTGSAYYLIHLGNGTSGSVIQYCKMAWAFRAIYVSSYASLEKPIANNIIMDAGIGIHTYSPVVCQNNLLVDCSYGIYSYGSFAPTLTNNTADDCYRGIHVYTGYASGGDISYNLLSNCRYGIFCAMYSYPTLHTNAYYNNSIADFQSLEGINPGPFNQYLSYDPYADSDMGDYFLNPEGQEFELLQDQPPDYAQANGLGNELFTIYAPTSVGGGTHSGSETWGKVGIDEPGSLLDIGYHHCRIDRYLEGSVTFSGVNASLTIQPGVVVALPSSGYLDFKQGAELVSVGDPAPERHNILVNRKALSMSGPSGSIESPQIGASSSPSLYVQADASDELRIQFTKTLWLYSGLVAYRGFPDSIRDNVFALSTIGAMSYGCSNSFLNNLFYRNYYGLWAWGGHCRSYNNTFDTNDIGICCQRSADCSLAVKDSLFTDSTPESVDPQPLREGISLYGAGGTFIHSHNAFYNNMRKIYDYQQSEELNIGASSIDLDESPYHDKATGFGASWFLRQTPDGPDDPIIIDRGSRSSCDAGLRYYTTDTSGNLDDGQVDMGYHYLVEFVEDGMFFVDPESGDDSNDGSYASPFKTVGHAVDTASSGNSIVLLPGTYSYVHDEHPDPDLERGIELDKSVNLLGAGAHQTILTGNWCPGDNYTSVPLIHVTKDAGSLSIEGLTLENRRTEMDTKMPPANNTGYGAGILVGSVIDPDDPHHGAWDGVQGVSVKYCTIRGNSGDYGAGICSMNSDVVVERCLIYGNTAFSGQRGGGIYCRGGFGGQFPRIKSCVIAGNGAGELGGVDGISDIQGGGGIACASSSPTIEGCIFANNRAEMEFNYGARGGHIHIARPMFDSQDPPSSPTIEDCLLINGMAYEGGGIAVREGSEAVIRRCLVGYSWAYVRGGGAFISQCGYEDEYQVIHYHPEMLQCEFVGNTAGTEYETGEGGALYPTESFPILANSIVAYNDALGPLGGNGNAIFLGPEGDGNVMRILGCTITGNVFDDGDHKYNAIYNAWMGSPPYTGYSKVTLSNSIIFNNGPDDIRPCNEVNSPRYCKLHDTELQGHGDGNIDVDDWWGEEPQLPPSPPRFVMAASGPFHLNLDDAFDEDFVSSLEHGSNADAYDHDPAQPPDEDPDVDGDERIIDCDNQEGARIDMGADECHPFKADCKIEKAMTDSTYDITLTWRSPDHALSPTYEVYRSFNPYSDDMTWELIDSKGPDGVTTSSQDYVENGDSRQQAFYKIRRILAGEADVDSDPVGFVNVTVAPGWNLISVPLQTRYDGLNEPDDEALRVGKMIGERLANGQQLRLWVLSGDAYVEEILTWDAAANKWMEDGSPSGLHLARGDAAIVQVNAGGPSVLTFLGWVPMDMGKARLTHWEGKQDFETLWGNPYPADTSLDEIPFLAYGYRTENDAETPDRVKILPMGAPTPESWIELYLTPDNEWCYYSGPYAGEPAPPSLLYIPAGRGFHYLAAGLISGGGRYDRRYLVVQRPWSRL